MPGFGLLALRLTVAVVCLAHGAHTLFGLGGGPGIGPGGLSNAAVRLSNLGLEPGFLIAVLTGVIQLAGGVLLAAGWLTRWAATAVLGRVLIDVWLLHLPSGFFLNWTLDPARGHGIEYGLVLSGALLGLVFTGPGEYSVDGWRARESGRLAMQRERLRRKF